MYSQIKKNVDNDLTNKFTPLECFNSQFSGLNLTVLNFIAFDFH